MTLGKQGSFLSIKKRYDYWVICKSYNTWAVTLSRDDAFFVTKNPQSWVISVQDSSGNIDFRVHCLAKDIPKALNAF